MACKYAVGRIDGTDPILWFSTEEAAATYIGTLPGASKGIYYLDGPRGEQMTKPTMTYKIVRAHFEEEIESRAIRRGLTLEEAREHCRRDDTHGYGWFDCYMEEECCE